MRAPQCTPFRTTAASLRNALMLAATLAASTGAHATDYVVTSFADDGSPGTLRNVLAIATATPGSDTIAIGAGTITLLSALPSIAGDNLRITGAGTNQTIVQGSTVRDDPAIDWRVFTTTFGPEITIENMTIRHGHINFSGVGTALGGGIHNAGILTLNNVLVADNVAESTGFEAGTGDNAHGGGLSNLGTMAINNCIISSNEAKGESAGVNGGHGRGGGVFNASNCHLSVRESTISDNTALGGQGGIGAGGSGRGGGVFSGNGATLNMIFSTISGNDALGGTGGTSGAGTGSGGGIHYDYTSDGGAKLELCTISGNTAAGAGVGEGGGIVGGIDVRISSCTITGNTTATASSGGGLFVPATTPADGPYVRNTILAGNTAASAAGDVRGRIDSRGYNLIQSFFALPEIDISTGFNTGEGNQLGVDPLLGSFGMHGGGTATISLQSTSPAVNAGTNLGIDPTTTRGGPPVYATDQRGYPREVGGQADIGAYELNGAPSGARGAERYR